MFKLAFPRLTERLSWKKQQQSNKQVIQTLSIHESPKHYDSDELFQRLQTTYPSRGQNYRYDLYSTWKRGSERALDLLNKLDILRKPGLSIVEAGCGDGMTGYALGSYGHDVTLLDFDDWRDARARSLKFRRCDLCGNLPFKPQSFDFVYSFNTFEHLYDPESAISELTRVCKNGGYLYLEFGPLYYSPWGLHAYRTVHMPYPQFLFSESFLAKKLHELGIKDLGSTKTYLQPLNKWRLWQFLALWQNFNCKIVSTWRHTDYSHLNIVKAFPMAFTGRGLAFDDITTQGLSVMLMKK